MAKKKTVIVMSAAAAALLAGILLLTLFPEQGEAGLTPPPVPIMNADRQDMLDTGGGVSAVMFAPRAGQRFTIHIGGESGSYTLQADDPVFDIDAGAVGDIASAAVSLTGLNRVTQHADDAQLAAFGLDSPRLSWQLQFADGSVEQILMGSDLPTGDGCYVKLSGSSEVYSIGRMQRDSLLMPLEELYDISWLPFGPATADYRTWQFIDSVLLEKGDGTAIEIVARSDGELASSPPGTSLYRMLQPFADDCNDYRVSEVFLYAITHVRPASIVALHPDDLSAYGLDNPARLTVTLMPEGNGEGGQAEAGAQGGAGFGNGHVKTLLIGNHDSGLEGRFVMLQGHDAVLLDPGGAYSFLDIEPHQLRSGLIRLPMIDTVSSVHFMLDGTARVLELAHDGGGLEGYLDGSRLSTENSRRLYSAALSVTASGGTDAPVPDTPPRYSVTVNFIDGGSDTVELYPLSDSQFLIVHEGESTRSYITRLALTQNLLSRFEILDAGGDLPMG